MKYLNVRVARRLPEAIGVVALELRDINGRALPAFSAGAHIDVLIREGLTRQYSICNSPRERDRYLIGVLRCVDSRGGSAAVHDDLAEGSVVRISEPRNLFPVTPGPKALLCAGGIGITPILCMAHELGVAGGEFELHYSVRSPGHAAFRSHIAGSSFADWVHFHFDDGPEEQKLQIASVLDSQPHGTHLYVCGPTGYIEFVTGLARNRGWPDGQIHVEHFSPRSVAAAESGSFSVEIASSGQRYTVPPEKSIFEVLDAAGIDIPISCEQGVCGTCLTRVLQGEPDHRDSFLTDDEHRRNDQMTVCCSRSKSPLLVLDL